MHRIVSQYLDGPWDSPSYQLKLLLEDEDDPSCSEHITAVTQLWCEIFGSEAAWLNTSVCVTCFAILWLAVRGEGVSSPVATTLDAAAGLARRQKWGLILPSSARGSRLTYQTVIGVRYPGLCSSYCRPHSCTENVCHLLSPGHEGTDWGCYGHGKPHVWCRALLEWDCQHASSRLLVR